LERKLPLLKHFILPGGHITAAWAHVARAVCRRAERHVLRVLEETVKGDGEEKSYYLLMYLNRLSDYLFMLARSGITGFRLLHGVENSGELYYASEIQKPAMQYVACLSGGIEENSIYFRGRVTEYIQKKLPVKAYDFYLCGRREMIRDVTLLVDERFEGSHIFTELFYLRNSSIRIVSKSLIPFPIAALLRRRRTKCSRRKRFNPWAC
jgi:hypothetical protein